MIEKENIIIGSNTTKFSFDNLKFYFTITAKKTRKHSFILGLVFLFAAIIMFFLHMLDTYDILSFGLGMAFIALVGVHISIISKTYSSPEKSANRLYDSMIGRIIETVFYSYHFTVDTKYLNGSSSMRYEYRNLNNIYYSDQYLTFVINNETRVITLDIYGLVDTSVKDLIDKIKEMHPYLNVIEIK